MGRAAVTPDGKLQAQYVMDAVRPEMSEGDEDCKQANAVLSSLCSHQIKVWKVSQSMQSVQEYLDFPITGAVCPF